MKTVHLIEDLFQKEREHLDYFFENLDIEQAANVFETLRACKGLLFFSGVGKSGLIAEKIAVTMTSTGTRALYLSPSNALHGDIGIIGEDDVFVMLSKSGESDELFELIPFLRNRNVTICGITSNENSRLNKSCDISLTLPLANELCPFGMAPTTSTTIQGIFGDIMVVALMAEKDFSLAEYALNHPAGRIGKRIALRVEDLMVKGEQIPTCRREDKLVDTLVELSTKLCGCVIVIDQDGKMEGIFTDGDLRRSLQKNGPEALEMSMGELMIENPRTTEPKQLAYEAMKLMESNQKSPIMVLPVIDDNRAVVGIIKMHDLVQSGI